jgi:hypothetical protein
MDSPDGSVELTLTGQAQAGTANLRCVFEASTNLLQWSKRGVRTNLTGTVQFTDLAAAKTPGRFYRTVAPSTPSPACGLAHGLLDGQRAV